MFKLLKPILWSFFILSWIPLALAEDWKGNPDPSEFSLGALTGLGLIDSSAGYSVIGTASKKIISHGFIPDVNDSVHIEGMVGPVFVSNSTAWLYSAHLRWDFQKDSLWTVFAMGGVGGNVLSVNSNNRFVMTPRFGVGAFYKINSQIQIRADIAHDLIGVGINFPL